MKKIFTSMIIALVGANLFAIAPTVADLASSYDVVNNVVLCIQFADEAEVCNDIYFVGTPTNWKSSFDGCPQFYPMPNFEGWYVAEIPFIAQEELQGKPIQAQYDHSFSWDYQPGDPNAWVHMGGNEINIVGYVTESDMSYPSPGAYIYKMTYWKNHMNPCDYILRHYTVSLYIPDACPNMKPAIIGSFNNWATGIAMTEGLDDNFNTVYTYSLNAIEGQDFQIKEASETGWTNRMQYYDEVNDMWIDMDNYVLGEDTNIVLNWSDNDFYRFSICGGNRQVVIEAKLPTKKCPANIEIIGPFDGWSGSTMTYNASTGYYETTISASALDEFKFRKAGDWTYQIMCYDSILNQWKTLDGEYRRAFVDFWNGSADTIVIDFGNEDKYRWSVAKIIDGSEKSEGYILGVGELSIGEQYQLTATPNPGYHFVQWSDSVTDNPRLVMLTQDTTFIAEFSKNIYTIRTSSSNPTWGTTAGDTAALYLDTVSISAIPNYGYHFVKWDGDDIIDNSITVATAISIASELPTNSESDIYTIVGYVVGKYNNLLYKIADTPNGGNTFLIYTGSQSVSTGDYISITGHIYKSSDLQYAYGDTQQVSFIKITNNLYNVVVKKNATYEAVFAKNVYSITKNAEHGSISGNSSAEYLDFVTLTVTPDYGYHFTQWSDGNTDNPRVFQITKDTTFTAEFAYDRVGTCGKDLALVWSYDPTKKVLTIGNSGEFTENMQFGVEAPNEMEELVIGNSVTAIGENAFAGISTLKKVTIGESVKTIHNNAFYNCVNLETIFNYRQTPTNAYSTAFDGVDKFECKLYVLPSSIDMYKAAAVWRDFYYTYAIGAVETTVTTNDVTVEPQDNAAIVTWPTSNNAATYTIQITKDGVVFCTLIFNANGQLTGIAFAPSRDGSHHAPAAIMTANGLQFTVTGLDSNTQYGYNLTAKDANDQTIATYSGSFTTTSEGETTGVEEVSSSLLGGDRGRLILRNGQVFILRGDKTYTLTGQEVK